MTTRLDKDSSMTVDWAEFFHHVIVNPVDTIGELVSSWKHNLVSARHGVKPRWPKDDWSGRSFCPSAGFRCGRESGDAHRVLRGGVWFGSMEDVCSRSGTGRRRFPKCDGAHRPPQDPVSGLQLVFIYFLTNGRKMGFWWAKFVQGWRWAL